MSRRHDVQSGDGTIVAEGPARALYVVKNTTPTNGVAGFGTGCFWINRQGTAGTIFYVNTGTVTSTTWLNIA